MSILASVRQACEEQNPRVLYLAIGCANSAIQQIPPFVSLSLALSLCIWVDPLLEDSPVSLGLALANDVVVFGPQSTMCVASRRSFHWSEDSSNSNWSAFMDMLYDYVQRTDAQLIVQDYSGVSFARFYPVEKARDRAHFLAHVLFDVTYGEGCGCYIDFDNVRILRRPGSNQFFQPAYDTLASIRACKGELEYEVDRRLSVVRNTLYPLYRMRRESEVVVRWFFGLYGLDPDSKNLRQLLLAFFRDFAASIECVPQSDEETSVLLDSAEFLNALDLLRLYVPPVLNSSAPLEATDGSFQTVPTTR